MGMDVFGKEPTDEKGAYFWASVWSWAPLRAAMERSCVDLLGEELLFCMAFNDGAGPDDQSVCTEIANRLERLIESDASAFDVETDLRVDASGRFLSAEEAESLPPDQVRSPYQVDAVFVHEFGDFLRHCGGFSVR